MGKELELSFWNIVTIVMLSLKFVISEQDKRHTKTFLLRGLWQEWYSYKDLVYFLFNIIAPTHLAMSLPFPTMLPKAQQCMHEHDRSFNITVAKPPYHHSDALRKKEICKTQMIIKR